jgi:DNA repair protein RadC
MLASLLAWVASLRMDVLFLRNRMLRQDDRIDALRKEMVEAFQAIAVLGEKAKGAEES